MKMKERILYIREKSGLNQEAFAQRIGVTKSAISGYETGRRDPSPQVLHSISREFRYDLNWLKTGEGEPEIPEPNDILHELFHQFSCSDFERAFLKAYFELQDDERKQFCSYMERVFGAAVHSLQSAGVTHFKEQLSSSPSQPAEEAQEAVPTAQLTPVVPAERPRRTAIVAARNGIRMEIELTCTDEEEEAAQPPPIVDCDI